jgi:hypothetical protein
MESLMYMSLTVDTVFDCQQLRKKILDTKSNQWIYTLLLPKHELAYQTNEFTDHA